MKKNMLLSLFLVSLSILGFSQGTPDNLKSIMGAEWECDKETFFYRFKFATELKAQAGKYGVISYKEARGNSFKLQRFMVNDYFQGQNISFAGMLFDTFTVKFNMGKFSVFVMKTSPDNYENMISIFIKKYGEPSIKEEYDAQNSYGADFKQVQIFWDSKTHNRILSCIKYDGTSSTFTFSKGNIEDIKNKAKEDEAKAVDIL